MTKNEPERMNVQTILVQVKAVSRDEAIGKAHTDAIERLPEHQIFTTACIEIKQNAEDKVRRVVRQCSTCRFWKDEWGKV